MFYETFVSAIFLFVAWCKCVSSHGPWSKLESHYSKGGNEGGVEGMDIKEVLEENKCDS